MTRLLLLLLPALLASIAHAEPYVQRADVRTFIQDMHERHGLSLIHI